MNAFEFSSQKWKDFYEYQDQQKELYDNVQRETESEMIMMNQLNILLNQQQEVTSQTKTDQDSDSSETEVESNTFNTENVEKKQDSHNDLKDKQDCSQKHQENSELNESLSEKENINKDEKTEIIEEDDTDLETRLLKEKPLLLASKRIQCDDVLKWDSIECSFDVLVKELIDSIDETKRKKIHSMSPIRERGEGFFCDMIFAHFKKLNLTNSIQLLYTNSVESLGKKIDESKTFHYIIQYDKETEHFIANFISRNTETIYIINSLEHVRPKSQIKYIHNTRETPIIAEECETETDVKRMKGSQYPGKSTFPTFKLVQAKSQRQPSNKECFFYVTFNGYKLLKFWKPTRNTTRSEEQKSIEQTLKFSDEDKEKIKSWTKFCRKVTNNSIYIMRYPEEN